MIAPLPPVTYSALITEALREDLGRMGDVTANACLRAEDGLHTRIVSRQTGCLAGLDIACATFMALDPTLSVTPLARDGTPLKPGLAVAEISGPARAIVSAERVALNILGRLSGIATLTGQYVAAVTGTPARIAATRKTTPLLRTLEKYAVQCGGGWPHRFGLDDAILIKDNHIAACGDVATAVTRARAHAGHMMMIMVEVDTLEQLAAVLPLKPHAVLLDNFSLDDLRRAVTMTDGHMVLEASGGVNLHTVRDIAETGVDVISVGALTHSAPVHDFGLDAI